MSGLQSLAEVYPVTEGHESQCMRRYGKNKNKTKAKESWWASTRKMLLWVPSNSKAAGTEW